MLYIHKEQLFAIADFKQFDQFDYEVCEMHCIALHCMQIVNIKKW